MSFFAELWLFLKVQKKYWLLPFILTLGLLGLLIAVGQSAVIMQFVYPFF